VDISNACYEDVAIGVSIRWRLSVFWF